MYFFPFQGAERFPHSILYFNILPQEAKGTTLLFVMVSI